MKAINREINLHDKQFQAYNFDTQYGAAIAGVQSGKTFLGAYWAGTQMIRMGENGQGLIVAPTVKILQQATLPKFFKEFPDYFGSVNTFFRLDGNGVGGHFISPPGPEVLYHLLHELAIV